MIQQFPIVDMELGTISFDEEVLAKIVEQVVGKLAATEKEKWIDGNEAMQILKITSKSTLQTFRDRRKIRFTQPEKRIILYDRDSIYEFLDKNAIDPLD